MDDNGISNGAKLRRQDGRRRHLTYDKLLSLAGPLCEYGPAYSRAVRASADWLRKAISEDRVSESRTAAHELELRLHFVGVISDGAC